MTNLIAEDVLLLLLDDRTGAFVSGSNRQPALAGAVLAELSMSGAIEIESAGGHWKRTKVVLDDPSGVSDPVLREALAVIGEKPRSPQDLVNRLGRTLPDQLCTRLEERGIVRREENKVLGLFPRTRWPTADAHDERDLRDRLRRALIDREDPDERTALVIAVLSAAEVVDKVVDHGSLSAKEIKRRAAEVAAGGWATDAVRRALDAARQATMVAVIVATTASVSGSG